jgi:hypothetical protein
MVEIVFHQLYITATYVNIFNLLIFFGICNFTDDVTIAYMRRDSLKVM